MYDFSPLAAPINTVDGYYNGTPEFLSTSYSFNGEGERWGYIHTNKGDSKAQGIINYPNRDVYSYGGKSRIKSAYSNVNSDLDEVASKGYSYYNTLIGRKNNQNVYQKDYHENVNDYQKNISQSIFSPGNTLPQYTQTIRDTFNPNYTPQLKSRAKSAAHRKRSPAKQQP